MPARRLALFALLAACSTTAGTGGSVLPSVLFDVSPSRSDAVGTSHADAAKDSTAVAADGFSLADLPKFDVDFDGLFKDTAAAETLAGDTADAASDAADQGAAELATAEDSDTSEPWQPPADCAAATQKVYLVTKDYQLLAYLPQTKQLTVIGTLECPAEYATWPFSMGVDRQGVAWVMYSSGELFQVSTATAQCTPTAWTPGDGGFIECGMGFAANAAGSKDETLYLGSAKGKLGAVDFGTWSAKPIGSLAINPGWPELTGTGKGELWGFFPMSQPAKVAQIDKTSGAVSTTKELTGMQMGTVKNWAFAHWGGRFLLFFQAESDPSTSVYLWDPQADTFAMYQANLGYPVVGAGVSSCAPTSWLSKP